MAKILYIEDIDDNVFLLNKILTAQGHDFHSARNAEEGLQTALSIHPDLILLDLGLPDTDGQTLSIWLRDEPLLKSIPIIVITAWPEEVAQHTVAAYHLNGFLCKPVPQAQLIDTINKALGLTNVN